jgi:hypothetical protein
MGITSHVYTSDGGTATRKFLIFRPKQPGDLPKQLRYREEPTQLMSLQIFDAKSIKSLIEMWMKLPAWDFGVSLHRRSQFETVMTRVNGVVERGFMDPSNPNHAASRAAQAAKTAAKIRAKRPKNLSKEEIERRDRNAERTRKNYAARKAAGLLNAGKKGTKGKKTVTPRKMPKKQVARRGSKKAKN